MAFIHAAYTRRVQVAAAALLLSTVSCVDDPDGESADSTEQDISFGGLPPLGPTTTDTPVGLALEIKNGSGIPLQVRAGQRFYINQLDMLTSIDTATDDGVAGLDHVGDFANLDWHNVQFVDESAKPTPNNDGSGFTRRRLYRKANWMDVPSLFVIEQLDSHGHTSGSPIVIDSGLEYLRTPIDSFFIRRMRAVQFTTDCASVSDCSHAHEFVEEALVELRDANGSNPNFVMGAATSQLRVTWSANLFHPYTVPVQQIANPQWDYGLNIDLAVTTPPAGPQNTYRAGQQLEVKFTLKDGSGNRLHPPGRMPTYAEYLAGTQYGGPDSAGIDYWDQTEKVMTYYYRKHKEKQMVVAMIGPVQDSQAIRTPIDLINDIFASTDGSVPTASYAADGVWGEAAAVPSWANLIQVFPWDAPVSDTVHFTLPANAKPGTYKIVMKARRSYLGEETPRAVTMSIQVGSPTVTRATLSTGGCQQCHGGGSDPLRINHGLSFADRDTCATCHAPLTFEPEGPVYVRLHFIHSRTDRLSAPEYQCSNCHLNRAGIQRTSKSACLSCHTSYPQSHVQQFGPIVDMYIGGRLEDSFGQCTSACHTNHPGSGL